MGDAKRIIVKPIASADARRIVASIHYSRTYVRNSQLHLGVFLDGRCGGAMQFGPPMDRRKLLGLVEGTQWNEVIELNRMAFADWLPRNSESRALGYALRWMRKQYPWIKWVVSFADAVQCGDGTIYRATGFVLTGIKPGLEHIRLPSGEVVHRLSLNMSAKFRGAARGGAPGRRKRAALTGGTLMQGFQLRYIYFLDPSARERLTVPVLPYSAIDEAGARMYRGRRIVAE